MNREISDFKIKVLYKTLVTRNSFHLLSSWDDAGGRVASGFSPEDFWLDVGMRGKTCIKDNYVDLL